MSINQLQELTQEPKRRLSLIFISQIVLLLLSPNYSIANETIASISSYEAISLTTEICDNRIDDDGDGLIDCLDPDCSGDISCWDCYEDFYQVHSNSTIVRLNPSNGSYVTVGSVSGASAINGAAMNHLDGHVYAPCMINGNHTLGMLMNDGTVVDLGLSLPGSILYVGGVSTDGKLFANAGGNPIYEIDLAAQPLSYVATGSSNPGVADFSVDNTSGLFYGINSSNKLRVYDPYADNLTTYDLAGSINNETGGYGATWSSDDGSFFAYNNSSGKIFTIDVNTLAATQVLNGVGNLSINDGFNCLTANPPFETYCDNGIDDDGDGVIDCDDSDCFNSNVCTYEICDNGIDDDDDGWVDCSDTECFNLSFCIEICDNGIDDNGNGLIDSDDPQCNTPSGIQGGLESNGSLADKIARRNVQRTINPDSEIDAKREGLIPFVPRKFRGQFDLSSFIPQQINNAYVAESTPDDLINITNAIDVIAADYYAEDLRVGAILAIESSDVYEHAKYICDRLDGSRLLDVSHLYSHGGLFQSYELLNAQLDVEYALNFSMYHDDNLGFVIENHWNLSQYPLDRDYYNFQIWARDYSQLIDMLNGTLDLILKVGDIHKINSSEVPRLFATSGEYSNGSLNLHVRNKDGLSNCKFEASLRRTETSDWEAITIDVPLTGDQEQIVNISVGYLYDMGASIQSQGNVSDEIFLADGRWTVAEDHFGATLIHHEIGEQITKPGDELTYQIERSINLKAEISNYFDIYRSLDPKFEPVDLSMFNSLSINGSGEGLIEITLVKESLVYGNFHPSIQIVLDGNPKLFSLQKEDFSAYEEDWSDIIMMTFTLISGGAGTQLFEISLSDIAFTYDALSGIFDTQLESQDSQIFPNPVLSTASITFEGLSQANGLLRIIDTYGRQVMSQSLLIEQGKQKVDFSLGTLPQGWYHYLILENGNILTTGNFTKLDN